MSRMVGYDPLRAHYAATGRNWRTGQLYSNQRRYYRRRPARKYLYQNYQQRMSRILTSVQPTSTFKRFVYPEANNYVTLNSGNGYASDYIFRGNSLYDPDYTGVGAQPVGFDEYGALYGRYNVLWSKITVTMKANSIPNGVGLTVYLIAYHAAGPLSLNGDDIEAMHKMKKLTLTNQANGPAQTQLSAYCKTSEIYPVSVSRSFDYAALWNANPGAMWFWHVVVLAHDSAEEAVPYFDVRLEYGAMLEEPVQLARS